MSFSAISQKLLDNWLKEPTPQPEQLYSGILDRLSGRMRLALIDVSQAAPLDWQVNPIYSQAGQDALSGDDGLLKQGRLADFTDKAYLAQWVFPTYLKVLQQKKPSMDVVETRTLGLTIVFDRIILPDRSETPRWLLVCTNGRFQAQAPRQTPQLDPVDETIVMHLMAGQTAKEIAQGVNLSPRTVEHRLERLKQQVGARSLPQLTAMLVVAGFNRLIDYMPSKPGRQKR